MSTRLFVGNIPLGINEEELRKEFSYYGKVTNVDLKQKQDTINNVNVASKLFAFITLEITTFNVNQCMQEFSSQKWKGAFLNVSIAKESFLDRLKRERAETGKPIESQAENTSNVFNHKILKEDVKTISHISNDNFKSSSKEFDNQSKKRKQNQIEMEDDTNKSFIKKKKKESRNSFNLNGNVNEDIKNNVIEIETSAANISDRKRLESLYNMKSSYNEKKSLIKMALSGVDNKKNKKIFFNDDDDNDNIDESLVGGDDKYANGEKKKYSNNRILEKTKTTLFDDDDSEDDNGSYNFEIKEQFEGESGRKLLELQSRYQSDKRFVLDKRFLEDEDQNNKEVSEVENFEVENVDENNDEIDIVNDDEKRKQMEILQGIIGDTKFNFNKSENVKKLPLKTMLRFDPSRPDHTKFLNTPAEKPLSSKKSKKDKKKEEILVHNEKSRPDEVVAPVVSQDRYYKVNESLKQSIEDKQPFSLLNLFGNKEYEEEKASNDNDKYDAKLIEKSDKKVKNPLGDEKNPFFYDTSDTEDESNNKSTKNKKNINPDSSDLPSRPSTIVENFFFSENDQRLIEALQFFLNAKPNAEKTRNELKSVVKKRIHNNMRNNKFQPKQMSKINKMNKSRKFNRKR